jgi:hypothetical protein
LVGSVPRVVTRTGSAEAKSCVPVVAVSLSVAAAAWNATRALCSVKVLAPTSAG